MKKVRLIDLRKQLGLTQAKMARELCQTLRHYQKCEAKDELSRPTKKLLIALIYLKCIRDFIRKKKGEVIIDNEITFDVITGRVDIIDVNSFLKGLDG